MAVDYPAGAKEDVMSSGVSGSSGGSWNITRFIIALTGLITAVTAFLAVFELPPFGTTPATPTVSVTLRPTENPPTRAPTPAESIPTAQEIYDLQAQSLQAIKDGRLAEADALLEEVEDLTNTALRHSPEDTYLLNLDGYHHKNVALLYRQLDMRGEDFAGQLTEAEKSFQLVLSLATEDPGAWNGLGSVYLLRCQLEKGEEYIRRALEIKPDYDAAMRDLEAIPAFERYCNS